MSADNGFYVLKTPKLGDASTFEFRVGYDQGWFKEGGFWDQPEPELMLRVWGDSPVFSSQSRAKRHARRLVRNWYRSGMPLEYGTSRVWVDVPFPATER